MVGETVYLVFIGILSVLLVILTFYVLISGSRREARQDARELQNNAFLNKALQTLADYNAGLDKIVEQLRGLERRQERVEGLMQAQLARMAGLNIQNTQTERQGGVDIEGRVRVQVERDLAGGNIG